MTQHTAEPWQQAGRSPSGKYLIIGADHSQVTYVGSNSENARRIVACVNACKGIDTEDLERGVVAELVDLVGKHRA